MSLAQRMHFLQDVFQIIAIALVSEINHYHTNGLHLFLDTLYNYDPALVLSQSLSHNIIDYFL